MVTTVSEEIIPWFESLAADTVVLTPNQRLSRFIQQQYAGFRQLQDRQAWPTLPCYSLSGWMQSLWDILQRGYFSDSDRVLLTAAQEKIIWERIILQHSRGHELLNPRHTAAVAMDAWHKLLQWQLDTDLPAQRQSDMALFKYWTKHYRDICRDAKFIDSSQIVFTLQRAISESRLPLPQAIALYGFDAITPLTRTLLDTCSGRGVNVYPVNISKTAEVQRIQLDSEDTEIMTAARWAAGLLAKHDASRPLQIGIVVPRLTSMRARVERLFSNVFEPQHLLVGNPRHVPGFNLSAAQPLAETPLVRAALNALQLNRSQLEMELVSHILRSPFIGDVNELSSRALLDVELRSTARTLGVSALRAAAGSGDRRPARASRCPGLFQRLQVFHRLQRSERAYQRLPSEWAELFAGQLQALGWPGSRHLDSLEFQQVRHWNEVLEQLAGQDGVCGQVDVSTGLAHLRQLAQQHPFHARTAQSPVQILGMLEAAGMLFDHVWVMHMDDQNWPAPPQPNPLIPIRRQLELEMPRVSVDAELRFARAMTKRLAGSGGQVIFSYSRYHGDQELRPSPLIEEYTGVTPEQLGLAAPLDYHRDLYQSAELSITADDRAPPVGDADTVTGGTQILKDQAACPFRACARHRLHAREIEQAPPGISPLEHGRLLHRALEAVWRELGNHAELMRLDDTELEVCINQAITESFQILPAHRKYGKRMQELESRRLHGLLRSWLEQEKQRQPFTVLFNESESKLDLAGLPLRVRYDRVDELADGSLFVIDYKTGKVDINTWSGPRLDEPQVPIYCITDPDRISGAAFGLLNATETGFKGIAANTAIAPGLKSPDAFGERDQTHDWQGILQYWREVLEQLAADFMNGTAAVDPKSIPVSCRFCALPGLCRIGDKAIVGEQEPDWEEQDAG